MPENVKRLYRSRENRMLGGVAAGLADYLEIDPTLVRLIFAFSFLLWGSGILVYIVMWLIVPEEPVNEVVVKRGSSKKSS